MQTKHSLFFLRSSRSGWALDNKVTKARQNMRQQSHPKPCVPGTVRVQTWELPLRHREQPPGIRLRNPEIIPAVRNRVIGTGISQANQRDPKFVGLFWNLCLTIHKRDLSTNPKFQDGSYLRGSYFTVTYCRLLNGCKTHRTRSWIILVPNLKDSCVIYRT